MPKAAALELGARPLERLVAVMLAAFGASEPGRSPEYLVDMLGVVGPVGGDMDGAARFEAIGAKIKKRRLHNTALVVPFLGPGIWKVEVYAREAGQWNLLSEHLDRIVNDQFQVRDAGGIGRDQAVAHTGLMYFDAEEVHLRCGRCEFNQRVAVTKTDLEHDRGVASKKSIEVDRLPVELEPISGPQFVKGALL